MPNQIDLKVKLNLTGPHNIRPVVNSLQSQLNKVKGSLSLKIDPKISSGITTINKKLDQFNAALRITASTATSTNSVLKQLGDTFKSLGNTTKVTNSIQRTQQALQKSTKVTKDAGDQLERFGELSSLALRRFAAFTVATTVVFGFARAVISATQEAIDFDRQLVKIAQVRNTTVRNLESLVGTITKLSTTLGVSSTELLNVAQTLAQAGLSARDVEKALDALAETSLAPTFTDITNTTEAAIAVMAQFKLEAEDLKDVFGSINKIAADFAVEADDLTAVIRKAGGVFANAGSQLDEPKQQLNELLALFTSVRATTRQSADSIATGFNTIFARLQRPGTIEFLRNFNIELADTEGRFVGAFEAVNRLNQGLKQFQTGDIELAQITEELGGIRQLRNIIPLIREFPVALKAFESAQEGVGSTTRDAIKAQQALAVQFQKVKEEFIALIRSISNSQTFRILASQILGVASSLIKLADSVKPILPILTALAGFQLLRAGRSFIPGFVNDIAGRPVIGRQAGGMVPGSGTGDTQPALLEPGEFVVPKRIVRKLGIGFFERMRRFQTGGLVGPGSTQTVIQPRIEDVLESGTALFVKSLQNLGLTVAEIDSKLKTAIDQRNRVTTTKGDIRAGLSSNVNTALINDPAADFGVGSAGTRTAGTLPLGNRTGGPLSAFIQNRIDRQRKPIVQDENVLESLTAQALAGEQAFRTQQAQQRKKGQPSQQDLLNVLGFGGGAAGAQTGRAAPLSNAQAINVSKFGLAGADLPTTAITPQLQEEIGKSFKDLSLTNKQYQKAIKFATRTIENGASTEQAINVTRERVLIEQRAGAQNRGLGTVDLRGNLALQRIAGRRGSSGGPGLVNRALGGIGGFFGIGRAPQTEQQQLVSQNRRAIAGGLASTAGFLLAGNLQGKGAVGNAASSGISGGLIGGGLVGSVAGGPIGLLAGVTIGIVSSLESFLAETNRLATEAEKVKFDKAIEGIEKAFKKGSANIGKLVDQAVTASERQIALRNDPNRSINSFVGANFFGARGNNITTGVATSSITRLFSIISGIKDVDLAEIGAREGFTGGVSALFGKDAALGRLNDAREGDKQARIDTAKTVTEPLIRTLDKRLRGGERSTDIFNSLGPTLQKQLAIAVGGNPLDFIFDKADIIAAEHALDKARVTLRQFAQEMDLASSKIEAANVVLDNQIDKQSNLFNVLSGGSLGDTVKSNGSVGNILGNLSGFSKGQVGASTGILKSGGFISDDTAKLTESLRLAQTELPQVLSNLNTNQNPGGIVEEFRQALNNVLPDIDDPIKNAILLGFKDNFNSDAEDFDPRKALRDFDISSAIGPIQQSILENLKVAAGQLERITQLQINSITQVIKAQESYQESLLNSISVEAEARERIAETLGQDVNAVRLGGFNAKTKALGATGPQGLGGKIFGLEQRGAQLRDALGSARTPEEAQKFGAELEQVNAELIKSKEALELFARDTTLATVAADKLAKAETKRAVGREIAGGILGNNKLGFAKQVSALERFQGGDLGTLFTSFEDLQAGLELQTKFLRATGREEDARNVERNFEKGIAEALGSPELAKLFTGAFNEEDNARKLQVEAAQLQIQAAKETLITQKALLDFLKAGAGPARARGGVIRGGGTGTSDSITARVSNGEYIIRAAAAQRLGVDTLDFINQNGELPGFARGGGVPRIDRIRNRLARDRRFKSRFDKAAQTALARRIRLGAGNSAGADANRAVIAGGINDLVEGDFVSFRRRSRGGNFSGIGFGMSGDGIGNSRVSPLTFVRQNRRVNSRNARFRKRGIAFASGGQVQAGGGVGLDTSAISSLNNFALAANNLAQAMSQLQNIPSTISLAGTHTVNINLNGAQALAGVMPQVRELVVSEIQTALSRYNQELKG